MALTMRWANPPTISSRSGSMSINQSSLIGRLSTRAKNPLTNSGVYVEPPPMTVIFMRFILYMLMGFERGNDFHFGMKEAF